MGASTACQVKWELGQVTTSSLSTYDTICHVTRLCLSTEWGKKDHVENKPRELRASSELSWGETWSH
jgi:hypothetical protein